MKHLRPLTLPLALAAGAIVVGTTACGSPGGTADDETTLVIASSAASGPNWDPASKLPEQYITYAVLDPLIYVDATTQEMTPWMAESWAWDAARTTVTIELREGQAFTDGEPYDAEAVVANLEYIRNDPAADRHVDLVEVTAIDVVDEYSFSVTVAEPNAQLLPFLGMYRIVSPATLEDGSTLSQSPVGSGPYILDPTGSITDSEYVFERNPDYWNPDEFPYDNLVIKILPDATARVNALKSGQVDVAAISTASAADVDGAGFTLRNQSAGWLGLGLNDADGSQGSPLGDVRVRQAMQYAIDREAITATVNQNLTPSNNQVWTTGQPFHRPERVGDYAYDPAEAERLLSEAGFADGFALTVPTTASWYTTPYEPLIAQYLADVGITITWDQLSLQDYLAAWEGTSSSPSVVFGEVYSSMLAQAVYPDGIHNNGRWTTPELDALLEAYNAGDEAAPAAIGDLIMDESWFIVASDLVVPFASAADVELGSDPGYLRGIRPTS